MARDALARLGCVRSRATRASSGSVHLASCSLRSPPNAPDETDLLSPRPIWRHIGRAPSAALYLAARLGQRAASVERKRARQRRDSPARSLAAAGQSLGSIAATLDAAIGATPTRSDAIEPKLARTRLGPNIFEPSCGPASARLSALDCRWQNMTSPCRRCVLVRSLI